ncbi:DUF1983 domain-containing protein [Salmonella enterica]|uniref:DUF1983 domain-containing protein n=2 Tax=Salmonella enterica TaxID=28901 RepID=A0A633DN15_SALER|nr:DUF1983 domain-containing protein [Salmonella enterica]EAS0615876.1 DUF1983 domain-containing protein [Salmonella enterica subsp. enterica serovar Dahomey]EBA1163889.1 DUF1983 domain-containing protein [Salmonella enterica subsp. enterica]EBF8621888.1 DUF1983 domain-containing protein [Salmonella enterica subsp. enterica serovar Istanbul]EBQ9004709.1 phage tail protein [Salmonella enterica subsp. enterica serovar Blockley]EBQ9480306.1 phage tail protein [Salmonella enterica subsp. enterica 
MSKKPWRAGKDLAALAENMEIATGQRGDGKDAFVTQGQLAELKLAKMRNNGSSGKVSLTPGIGQEVATWFPPPAFPSVPQNFVATGGFGSVLLEWDMPNYRGHSLTEIWRATEDNLSDAILVGTTPGQVYSDPVDPGWNGFYWVRFVNSAGVQGPYNHTEGTAAETKPDIDSIIDTIQDEINNSPIIKSLDEIWAIKATAGDIKAGIGIVAQPDGTTQIGLAAGKVFIFDPNNPDDKGNYAIPFAVVDGKVVIDEAAIREATIKILNAQHIVADEIKVGATLTAPVIRSGIIDNGPFQVDSNGNLRIGSLFSISSQGQISIRNATTNIGLVIRNDRIEVYDSAGNLVVRMGRLR